MIDSASVLTIGTAAIAGAIGLELGVVDHLIIDGLQGNGAARAIIAIGLDERAALSVECLCSDIDIATSGAIRFNLGCAVERNVIGCL
jgi:hypothetical protein